MDARGEEFLTLVRLDAGDRIIESLTAHLAGPGRGITSGFITGIGAAAGCELGYYDVGTKSYTTRVIEESCEIVSLTANIARIEGEPLIHAHIALAGPDLNLVGGHLVEGMISVTGEFWIHGASIPVTRKPGDFPGLKLIRFDD
jgi:predicted DNA-binding protein with PD1-like motif